MANLSGALGGAASGAGVGSFFGPIGTGIGAVAGGVLGLFGGGKGKKHKLKPYNKQSSRFLESVLQGGGLQGNPTYGAGNSFLQNLLSNNPEAFSAFEAP